MTISQQHMFAESRASYGPVECLGITFENDAARRTYFLEILRQKLQDPEFRKIEGFPIGSDDDILALSNPPYYTSCPNPFLQDFIKIYGKSYDPNVPYRKEPFAVDVSEGKTDPIYNAHSYHTKVPHKAIMRYILHYTQPGDMIFDGFCGSGMTGVAAQLCGNLNVLKEMGYFVDKDGALYENEPNSGAKPFSQVGTRRAVLNDLSTAATFIAYNYNGPADLAEFEREARRILSEVEAEIGWMYETLHTDGCKGRINYTVWSETFTCPHCNGEIIYYDAAVSKGNFEVNETFTCPHCTARLDKKSLQRAWESDFDEMLKRPHALVKYKPVLINYQVGSKRFEKHPDGQDFATLQRIQETSLQDEYPFYEMPDGERKKKDGYSLKGITHLHHFYFRRALLIYARLWKKAKLSNNAFVRFFVQGNCLGFTKMNRYSANHFSQVNRYFSGTLFVGSLISEVSPTYSMTHKLERLIKLKMPGQWGQAAITCQSTTYLPSVPENTFDYVFVDPPFGNNLHYSELNFLWEAWLKVLTQRDPEAVMDNGRHRSLLDYQNLMASAFQEINRVLKPGRWMTVEFHNSKNSVWNAIQEAMQKAGFVVADVRTLDKQQETYKQSIQKLVKQDLVITAYKPNGDLEERFKLKAGTVGGAWDFIQTHLRQLPVAVIKDGSMECLVERMAFLLYDRMVAFHVQHGILVPLSAAELYAGLEQRFAKRDDMFFLPEQVMEYDKKRLLAREVQQIPLIVVDEADAIQWLRQVLSAKPQTYSDLYPQFVNQLQTINKHEKLPELSQLLEQNFLRYDCMGDVPSQIHAHLSSNFKELRSLPKEHLSLRQKAKDRWYVPDPNKSADLEKVREKALLREFDEYRSFTGRELKQFRLEAVRVGFRKAWQDKDYPTIIKVSQKIPEDVLQEDSKLIMWYDQALTRSGK